jgi:hypothetical protein
VSEVICGELPLESIDRFLVRGAHLSEVLAIL